MRERVACCGGAGSIRTPRESIMGNRKITQALGKHGNSAGEKVGLDRGS